MVAPPPKPKKPMKKLAAAKAIAIPKRMETPRRKPEPDSEKATPNPNMVTAITPPAWATGPVQLLTTCCNGPSQGMPEPPAKAGLVRLASTRPAVSEVRRL